MSKKVVLFILIAIMISIPLLYYGMKTVNQGEVGVKTRMFPITGKQGVAAKGYGPGMYFILPFAEKMDIFNGRVQKLELTAKSEEGDRKGKDDVYVQTSDGTYIYVDATLLFRINRDKAPLLLKSLGHKYLTLKVRPEFIAVLKYKLGQLKAEDFYNAKVREGKITEVKEELNKRFANNGIEVIQVLIRDYHYKSGFENAIQKRKLADQLALLNHSKAKASEQASEQAKVEAMGEAMAKVEIERGKAEAEKIRAEAKAYVEIKKAEALKLVKLAEANGDKLIEKAMQGIGGKNIAAMEMADVIKGIDKIIIQSGGKNGINPLDIEQLLKLTGVKK
jgi:regulator of protease activity HflC (stomatin/prohibitin superfamily)